MGAENPEVAAALDTHWGQVASTFPNNAAVLDIACGNGAAALALARAGQQQGKAFAIAGIDAAAIEPARFAIRHGELLRTIQFQGNVRMEELPFAPNSFDAVISQYGFEYGDLAKAASEVARVLKPMGYVSILALPASATILDVVKGKMRQNQHVLTQTKLFDVALAVVQALHLVESSGGGRDTKQYLDRFNGEVERTMARFTKGDSDMVIAVIVALQKIITDRKAMDISLQLGAINMLKKRVTEHVIRTEAMTRAALGDAGINGLKRRLTEAGIVIAESKPISVSSLGTIAWRVSGRKGE